jgi:hypothetical protein
LRKEEAVATVQVDQTTTSGPGAAEVVRRVAVLLFGLIQIVIGARIVLLLLNAREVNGIVSGILNVSQVFVAPFEGILKTNSLTASGSVLDIAAVVAFVAWTVIEVIVVAAVSVFRRQSA